MFLDFKQSYVQLNSLTSFCCAVVREGGGCVGASEDSEGHGLVGRRRDMTSSISLFALSGTWNDYKKKAYCQMLSYVTWDHWRQFLFLYILSLPLSLLLHYFRTENARAQTPPSRHHWVQTLPRHQTWDRTHNLPVWQHRQALSESSALTDWPWSLP